jgi:hypothetical protein
MSGGGAPKKGVGFVFEEVGQPRVKFGVSGYGKSRDTHERGFTILPWVVEWPNWET